MSDKQSETLGSQRLLQIAVNKRPELIRSALEKSGALKPKETIEWLSPLKADRYVEYRDRAAQKSLRLEGKLKVPL